jgi:hypothetical protein
MPTYPEYTEISTPEVLLSSLLVSLTFWPTQKKFYQYSNDNNVYTELASGGAIEVFLAPLARTPAPQMDSGILIFFAMEGVPSLDNSLTGASNHMAPRNLGFVKTNADLQIISEGLTLSRSARFDGRRRS